MTNREKLLLAIIVFLIFLCFHFYNGQKEVIINLKPATKETTPDNHDIWLRKY